MSKCWLSKMKSDLKGTARSNLRKARATVRKKNQFKFAWIHVTILLFSPNFYCLSEGLQVLLLNQEMIEWSCAILVTFQQDQYFNWEVELLKVRSLFIMLHIFPRAYKNLQNSKPKILAWFFEAFCALLNLKIMLIDVTIYKRNILLQQVHLES